MKLRGHYEKPSERKAREKAEAIRREQALIQGLIFPHALRTILAELGRARALLFPSLYEGFGLPVLEAMSLGTPVMTSKAASPPEIAGDAALLVDPLDIRGMTKAIRIIDADSDLCIDLGRRGAERAKLFSPAVYRQRVGALYRSVLH